MFSVRPEHQEAVTAYMREMPDGEKFHCAACKISADTAAELWEDCHKYQKKKIFGVARCHSNYRHYTHRGVHTPGVAIRAGNGLTTATTTR